MPSKVGTIDRLSPLIDSTLIDREIRRSEKEQKQREETLRLGHINVIENKHLVSAISDLRKTIENSTKDEKEPGDASLASKLFGGTLDSLKELTSAAGVLRKLGQASGSGVIGTITSHFADKLDSRGEAIAERKTFISNAAVGTVGGRKLVERFGDRGAAKILGEKFDERRRIQSKIGKLESIRDNLQKSGVPDADLDPKFLKQLEGFRADLENNSSFFAKGNVVIRDGKYAGVKAKKPAKVESTVPTDAQAPERGVQDFTDAQAPERGVQDFSGDELRQTFIREMITGVREEIETLSKEDQKELKQNPEALNKLISLIVGASEAINEISDADIKKITQALVDKNSEGIEKDQLTELKKISSALVENQLQAHEDAIEAPRENNVLETVKETPKASKVIGEMLSSLVGGIGSKLTSVFTDVTGTFAKLLPAIGTMLEPLVSVLGPIAGVLGAGAAGYGAGKLLNNFVLNPLAEKLTGTEGATLGTAIYDGVDKVMGLFGKSDDDKLKKAKEEAELNFVQQKIKEGKPIPQDLAERVKKRNNISIPDELIIKPKAPAPVSETTNAVVENITKDIDATTRLTTRPAVIQGAPQTNVVNNTSNTTQIYNKPIRNSDPTWNSTMDMKIVY